MPAPKDLQFALLAGLAVALMCPGPAEASVSPHELVTVTPESGLLNTSDTRANGHVEFTKFGLRVFTDGNTDDVDADNNGSGDHYPGWADKAAGYIAVDYPLTEVGHPALEWLYNEPLHLMKPGLQIVIDKDDDGDYDGILVGEPWVYGDDWWSGASGLADSGLSCPSGCGNTNSGTLDEWRTAYPAAQVMAVGFSLGSGAHGNGTLQSMTYGDTRYEFTDVEPTTAPVVALKAKARPLAAGCDRVRIKLNVRKLVPGTAASTPKVIFKIKDRARQVGRAGLTPGATAVFRHGLGDHHRLHVYKIYGNGKLLLKYKVRNTCE